MRWRRCGWTTEELHDGYKRVSKAGLPATAAPHKVKHLQDTLAGFMGKVERMAWHAK
jgi:hypothetical protein